MKFCVVFSILVHVIGLLIVQNNFSSETRSFSISAPSRPPLSLNFFMLQENIDEIETQMDSDKLIQKSLTNHKKNTLMPHNASHPKKVSSQGFTEAKASGKNSAPEYPVLAKRLKQEGVVLVRLFVNSQGKVYKVELTKSSGFHLLDNEVLKTVKHYIFTPATRQNKAVNSYVDVPFRFRLNQSKLSSL